MDVMDDKVHFSSSLSRQNNLPTAAESHNPYESDTTTGWKKFGGKKWYDGKKYQIAILISLFLNVILMILVVTLFVLRHQQENYKDPVSRTKQLHQMIKQDMSDLNITDQGNFNILNLPTFSSDNSSGGTSVTFPSDESDRVISFILKMAGWEKAGNVYYKKFTDRVTYGEAQNRCQAIGGDLAAKVFRMPDAVSDMVAKGYSTAGRLPNNVRDKAWIGFNDLDQESEWRWYDGGKTNWNLIEWKPGEPNNGGGNQDCGQMFQISDGKIIIDDGFCSLATPYVCEIEIIY